MKFFQIKRTQAWVNLAHVVSVFKQGDNYTLMLDNGNSYKLTEDEYGELTKVFTEKPHFDKEPPKEKED